MVQERAKEMKQDEFELKEILTNWRTWAWFLWVTIRATALTVVFLLFITLFPLLVNYFIEIQVVSWYPASLFIVVVFWYVYFLIKIARPRG